MTTPAAAKRRTPQEVLLKILEDLGDEEFKRFKWFVSQRRIFEDLPSIPKSRLENADRMDTVDQMSRTYCINTVKVTKRLLVKIPRNDLLEEFPTYMSEPSDILSECQRQLKAQLTEKFECVSDGLGMAVKETSLNQIYTELYITEGGTAEFNDEHEVRQIEAASRKPHRPETSIRQEDIFKVPPRRRRPVRAVMTMGVAGIGKTVLTQKFTLDWAEGKANQDIQLLFPFTFRELNALKEKKFSLVELVHHCFTETKEAGICSFEQFQVVFIFDGLDECRLPLDFHSNEPLTDATESTSVDVLLTNLIRGNLLPSARLWITTRPAAANQIPPGCVDIATEVRGFTDPQKEEYFRRRFRDEEQASSIISHIQTSRSLHIMCHIPVFCWITAKVLEDELKTREGGELPKTLTEMYIHFLVVQTKVKKVKYDGGAGKDPDVRKVIESLGKLAFQQLLKGNLIFYESDLRKSGIDIRDASLYSGVFTEIFREERGLYDNTVYCFVHLSVQEFLAAVYMIHCYTNRKKKALKSFLGEDYSYSSLDDFLNKVMEKSLDSRNGNLDLFVRFLHGLSVESNQSLLAGLLGRIENSPETIQRVINNLKKINRYNGGSTSSPDRSINIFHCLMEMNDLSVYQEIQEFLKSENRSEKELSEIQCSALAYMLQMSEEVLEEFDPHSYKTTDEGQHRLVPVVRNCRKFRFSSYDLSEAECEVIASAMKSSPSHLRDLDLRGNSLYDPRVKILSTGLESPNCQLEVLRISQLSETECEVMGSALKSNPSHLKELDLEMCRISGSGVKFLSAALENPDCKLEALRLYSCELSNTAWEVVASGLQSNPSYLKKLKVVSDNGKDSEVELLSGGLGSPNCRLETLRLDHCSLSETSWAFLGSALKSNPSHLRHLRLNTNSSLNDSALKPFSGFVESPHCKLKTLSLCLCSLSEISCALLGSALMSNPGHLTELDLSYNKLKDAGVMELCGFLESQRCTLKTLRLVNCFLTAISCALLASALKFNPSQMTELDLSHNKLRDSGVKHLYGFLNNQHCKLESLGLVNCSMSKVSCDILASTLKSNLSHLTTLDCGGNNLTESDVKQLSDIKKSPHYKLKTLSWK
ncbi:protein NLRC3-like [Leuresthes tenuis]|uniref:protein NLRC3-like n=1 Tax=Leuresthes tenuis TaxID=355514 RepID=UPI003B50F854